MMRTRLVVLGLLILLGVSVLLIVRSRSRSKTAPPANTVTARPGTSPAAHPAATAVPAVPLQQQLAADIRKNGVTPDRAKLLFSMVVGPLPGVSVPAESRDRSDFDGTLAVGYLYQVRNSLTPEQQKAAEQLIAGSSIPEGKSGAAPQSLSVNHVPVLVQASYTLLMGNTPAYDYLTLAKNANGTLAAFLGVPRIQGDITVEYGTPTGTEYAHAWSWSWGNIIGWDKGCHITVWDQKFQALDENDAEAVVTHEMFHCFQQRTAQTVADWSTVNAWIVEGEPTWAMSTVVPAAVFTGIFEGKWNLYVFGPKTVYSDRSYDAIGVYGHMGDVAGSQVIWPRLLPMVLAGMGKNDTDAFKMLIQGNEIQYYTSWGSSYFEVNGNTQWSMQTPGSPPTSGPAPDSISVDVLPCKSGR